MARTPWKMHLSGVISNSLLSTGGESPKKVAQNDMKHILVLQFLRSNDFLWVIGGVHEKF